MSLKIGDKLPLLILRDQNNEIFNLADKIGRNLVVYFYPKNFTPGCTREACSFRDNYNRLIELGAEVIGISGDSTSSHKKFIEAYNLDYTLLSDTKKEAEKAFGVKRNLFGLLPGRETFIFNNKGILLKKFSSQLAATKHVDEAIKILDK